MSDVKLSCAACKFSFTLGNDLHCRRNPPTGAVLVKHDQGVPLVAGCVSVWPVVGIDQWCGEFGPKPELLSS